MTIETFFEKFDQFADAPNAVTNVRNTDRNGTGDGRAWEFFMFTDGLAPLRGAFLFYDHPPVVSFVPHSTTGYKLTSLRDDGTHTAMKIPIHNSPCILHPFPDTGGVPACGWWVRRGTGPDHRNTNPKITRTPAVVQEGHAA